MSCGSATSAPTHTTPWGSQCRGFRQDVALIDELRSDVLQIRLSSEMLAYHQDSTHWQTLTAALSRVACHHLNIKAGDVQCGFRSQPDTPTHGELYLYDTTPGGAGYVQLIQLQLPDILRSTAEALSHCINPDCTPDASCYACLRTQDNQFAWPRLRREDGLAALRAVGV